MSRDATGERTTLRGTPGLSTIGFLAVSIVIGYEWFISGLVKFVRGGFPAGLADELTEKAEGTAAWYGRFIESAVVPNAAFFGYATEISEVLAGVALIGGPLLWLFAWDRVSDRVRSAVLLSMAVAAIGGAFLAVNLHLANGASHPWFIPQDAFDEGIDLDSVLPAIQIVIATVCIVLLRRLRRERAHMYEYLTDNGLARDEYHWFLQHGLAVRPYCVMGNDYYVTNEHLVRADGRVGSSGDVFGYYVITKQYFDRYHLPVMHTETNLSDADAAPEWLWKQWANVVRLKADGVPVIGFTWYSLHGPGGLGHGAARGQRPGEPAGPLRSGPPDPPRRRGVSPAGAAVARRDARRESLPRDEHVRANGAPSAGDGGRRRRRRGDRRDTRMNAGPQRSGAWKRRQ